MGFLSDLGGIINDQFGIGENTSHSLDNVSNGIVRDQNQDGSFGQLGAFAKKLDQSAERYYMEDGFIRDIRPRSRSILFQQPDIYVVVKKRMFASLKDNVRLDLLEDKERILIAATKRLFQNKTRILSAYEKLTKIEQLTFEAERFNTHLGPSLIDLVDSSSDLFGLFELDGNTKSAINTLRKVISYGEPGKFSNWTTNDYDAVFGKGIGEGPGTFELTNVASVNTRVSTEWGGGGADLTLEDPYNLLTITEKDIDQALTDVTNPMRTGSFFMFADIELQNTINDLKSELAVERARRQASQITFKISPGTILSKRVRAILDDEGVEIKFEPPGIFSAFSGPGSLDIDSRFLEGNDDPTISPNNQLNNSERDKFAQIIINTFTLLGQRQTSQRELAARNAEVNYARNRMRLFFNGKYVIQPMDTVSIWMSSRTGEDARLPGGFRAQQNEGGFGLTQKFDNIVKNLNNEFNRMSIDSENGGFKRMTIEEIERISIVGPKFPKWLWRQFKQDITGQPTGPCVFTGLVGGDAGGVSGSWGDGKWTIKVSCEDNSGYFNKSQINFKPAADVFNATIYDPLTPFDVSFDAATGVPATELSSGDFPPLLPENQKLLQSGLLTFQTGPNKGNTANETLYQSPAKEIAFGSFRAVLHDPQGMVYRWKQGIQTLTKSGRPDPQTTIDQERTVLLTNEPFAGQDIMNVISVLITGQPYNYGNFLKAAIANGNSLGARKDEATNLPAAETYIQGLIRDIERANAIWGDFLPHKKLIVNPAMEKFIAEQRIDLITQNTKLKAKLRERARVEDELTLIHGGFKPPEGAISRDNEGRPIQTAADNTTGPGDVQGTGALDNKVLSLSREIAQDQQLFMDTLSNQIANNSDIGLTLIGNDIEANPTLVSSQDTKSTPAQKQRDDLQLRQKLFKFTARRYWQVRANDDKNLFIVDDQYDRNLDIQAFERALAGGNSIQLFNSQYTTIGDQVSQVKKILGLECFANTQGHIEVRPPLYNRIPSSVFYKMFKERDERGVKVFPDFLENLYFNQIKQMFYQIEVLEDEIRLRAYALGSGSDAETIGLISSGGNTGSATIIGDESFSFLTNEYGDGKIGGRHLRNLLSQANPDFAEGWTGNGLAELSQVGERISKAAKIRNLFSLNEQVTAATKFNVDVAPNKRVAVAETIRDRLRIKTGREPKKISDFFSNPQFQRLKDVRNASASQIDRINIIEQIGNLVSERQQIIRSLSNALRNLQDGVLLNAPDVTPPNAFQKGGFKNLTAPLSSKQNSSGAAVNPFLNRRTEIPQFLEHMIEYEDEDDVGYQSGRRYVITADRIVSLTISENPPPYTMVTVNGLFGEGFVSPPGSLNLTSDGGNAITSAFAVDYDMWYQYGFRAPKAIEAPFLSDPDTQCAPFAVSTLLEARENILQGSVEIAGYNEFYQPGDVVFIEDRNLLFYVQQVAHSFSYGKLSTTLTLTYGHSPGEYIPTMLDVVGKILYGSGFVRAPRNNRQPTQGGARSLGALAFVANVRPLEDSTIGAFTRFDDNKPPLEQLLSGRWGERNKDILTNILYAVSGSLNQVSFRRQKALIKIVYYKTASSFSEEMRALAEDVKDWLIYPEENSVEGLSPLSGNDDSGQQKSFGIGEDDIIIEEVDMSDKDAQTRQIVYPDSEATDPLKNTQGPSSAAVSVTRSVDFSDLEPDEFRDLLANTVLDIFIKYQAVRRQTASENAGDTEAGQAQNAAVDTARVSSTQAEREQFQSLVGDDEG